MKGKKKQIRAEIPSNLKEIKQIEKAYEMDIYVYISIEPYPPKSSGMKLKQWTVSESGVFFTIGWSPKEDVRGTYWINANQTNFTAYGIIDLDGDGQFTTYMATRSENPNAPITGPDVY